MIGNRTLQVGMLCYPKPTQLDLTGPYEVLSRMPDTHVRTLWKDTVPVRTESGFCIVADLELGDAPKLHVLVVPGGLGQQDLMEDDEALPFSKDRGKLHSTLCRYVRAHLCLGLRDCFAATDATCHWMFLPSLQPFGAIPTAQRVVIDRNRVTVAGVSAGIDSRFS